MKKRLSFVCFISFLAMCIVGCGMIQKKKENGNEIDFTVVKKEDFPPEMAKIVEEKQQQGFQMTYQTGEDLYVLKGYGIQSSGGYSIQVISVTEREDMLCVKTKLVGPASNEEKREAISCPYVVLKVKACDKKVIFEEGGI